ncbi:hypothetical protein C3K47_09770 [Solitalea longa]|uniref:IPT/TIG domain-containing protein n=1 Tax=Solitalea longa TaxID=2079460 RepID=A0A2S5A2X9_9SPHI|nr:IPT/TIG domain-containing protein [Solitalea longa]POY36647.1 hypothetical protein C3K47_09770 [Solitalea longa]
MKKVIKSIAILSITALAIAGCKKDDLGVENPTIKEISASEGSGGDVITITGSDLAEVESIVFDNHNVPASFNPVFNNPGAIIFRVPDTAYGGAQNILIKNSKGHQLTVPFSVIALPTITTAYPTDFAAGSTVTITGNNLETAEKVILDGTTSEATIVSKSRKELVIKMPASTLTKAKLRITNSSGDRVSTMDFINVDAAYSIFTESLSFDNWSWGGNYTPSSETAVTGEKGIKGDMVGNAWGALSLHSGGVDLAPYNSVGFWIKGGTAVSTYRFFVNWQEQQTITVPANQWTYFTFPLSIWKNKGITSMTDIIWQVEGDGQLIYFDNVVLIK